MASKIQIFGMGGAACTQRITIAALENGAEFDINLVDLRKGEHKQPAHLARQPFGVIPALEEKENGFSLYESRAITRYVDASRGGKLTPADIRKRALMEQWISLEQGTITPETSVIAAQRIFTPMFGGKTDEAAVAKAVEKLKQPLDIMDAHLAKNAYLAGDSFSLADVFFLPYLALVLYTPEATLITSRPHLAAWWKRVSERPSWIKTLALSEFEFAKQKI